jgi:hypothetical protein
MPKTVWQTWFLSARAWFAAVQWAQRRLRLDCAGSWLSEAETRAKGGGGVNVCRRRISLS